MSEQTSQEPTMEEILASIRRIISEDDAPASADAQPGDPPQTAAAQPTAAAEPEPEPVDAAAPELSDEPDEVLELTERVESHGDIDVYTPAEPAPSEPEPEPVAAATPPPLPDPEPISAESLVGATAAAAAASAFSKLSATVAMPAEGRTLEDVVRELLRPMLKQWLDDNLPTIVQAAVNEEVERIARSRVR